MEKDKKSKVLSEAEEHNIDLGNKLFITEQVKKDYFREHPEEDIDKDFQEAADKYYKPVERRQELYDAIHRQYGIKPNFKSNFDKYGDDAKYLNKTLSSVQRGTKHLENNYNKLVRLIEAKKKKYN